MNHLTAAAATTAGSAAAATTTNDKHGSIGHTLRNLELVTARLIEYSHMHAASKIDNTVRGKCTKGRKCCCSNC